MSRTGKNHSPGTGHLPDNSLQEMLFERMPMGIAIFDTDYNIQRYNPTWAEFSELYAPSSGAPLTQGVNYFDHLPGTESVILPLFKKVLDGETVREGSLRLETGGRVTYWDVVLAPLSENETISGILTVTVDITERMQGQLNLEKRVWERTLEIERRREIAESLRDIIGMINAGLPLDTFLDKGVKLAAERLGAAACVLHQFDLQKEVIHYLASYGMGDIPTSRVTVHFNDLEHRGAANYLKATLKKKPTYTNYPDLPDRVEQIRRAPNIPEEIRTSRIALRERFASSFSVPLYIRDEVYGGMVFYYTETQEFSEDQIELGLTFAEQVGLAIENARLHDADEVRQRELQILLDVAETANSSLNLENLLTSTLDLLVSQLDISRVGVSLLDESTGYLLPDILRPEREVSLEEMAVMMAAGQEVINSGKMRYITPDPDNNIIEPGALIPLQIRGHNLGLMGIIGKQEAEFSESQLALYKSIADQLGVAIENARLFKQAEETAVMAERNRLARDLHDAVTQTLFSSSLIADVLPMIWDKNPQEGQRRLEELRQLTRGALSEMRTLLMELRPAALADADLKDLINHLINAFTARTRLQVTYQEDLLDNPPPEIKEMIYRITQEGFNNIAKHADANHVNLELNSRRDHVKMSLRDDGIGFKIDGSEHEGLGLGIMQERAESLGATIKVRSKIGQGTVLTVIWQKKDQEEQGND